ncbi:hypothetical protein BH11ACT5_BH11ACT5_05630 [soil metagenome]
MRSGVAQGIARGVGAACFLVLPVLLLGSCMTRGQADAAQDAPSLAEARSALYSTLDDTQELIGGDWTTLDDPNSRGCILGDVAGRTFSALRTAAPVADPSAAVAAAWEDAGFTVETTAIGPVSQLVGTSDGAALLIFRLSDRAMTLQGESECRPASPR